MSPRFAVALAASLFCLPAAAAQTRAYTPQAFDAAQAAGAPILVEVHAPWCPTCKEQGAVLQKLEAQDKFAALQVFHVDFDSQKEALARFRARMQSTLIAFKGKAETGRSTGETDAGSIAALLDKTQ
jgi:thioredoxin-like negative regulator of GroEL